MSGNRLEMCGLKLAEIKTDFSSCCQHVCPNQVRPDKSPDHVHRLWHTEEHAFVGGDVCLEIVARVAHLGQLCSLALS